ncbi:MAG: PucR family transcriptional regulator [Betaproteobacteria bacterium]|nr:PucR family transcriptional regulator [Betaproteobacteria bacterium]
MDIRSFGQDNGLAQTLASLSKLGVVPRIAAPLERQAGDIARGLRETILAEIPAFTASGNPDVLPDLGRHAGEHIAELQRLLGGGDIRDFEFVRAHARRRASQRFPLEAALHAYRCGHKVLSQWIREAALTANPRNREKVLSAVAAFSLEYTDTISIIAAADYVARTRVLAEAEGDRRTELLNILVSGYDESDGRVARLLKRAGYLEQRQSFCVALAQSVDPLEMENPTRAQRIAEAVSQAVAPIPVRALAGIRGNVVTAVFSGARRASGWTAPQANLASRIQPRLLELGPAVLIGMSSDQPSTSFIPRGLHEATVALDFANVTERVVQFSALPVRRLLIHRGADYVQSAMPVWFPGFRDASTKSQGSLVKTLRALADADMNMQRAARELHVHPNTIYARLQRISDLTGLDAQRYHQLTDLLLAADCGRA